MPGIEHRLRQLEQLKTNGVITDDEYVRLRQIEQLNADGAISEDEYQKRRKALLDPITARTASPSRRTASAGGSEQAGHMLHEMRLGLRRFWALKWIIKGPILAAIVAFIILPIVGGIAGGGSPGGGSPGSPSLPVGIDASTYLILPPVLPTQSGIEVKAGDYWKFLHSSVGNWAGICNEPDTEPLASFVYGIYAQGLKQGVELSDTDVAIAARDYAPGLTLSSHYIGSAADRATAIGLFADRCRELQTTGPTPTP